MSVLSTEELAQLSLHWMDAEAARPDLDADFPVGAVARSRWQSARRALVDAAPRMLATIAAQRKALQQIAEMTPDGSHSLDGQLAPRQVEINAIARAALNNSPTKADGT